jgi:hypothetical protein
MKTCHTCLYMRPGNRFIWCRIYKIFREAIPCVDHKEKLCG